MEKPKCMRCIHYMNTWDSQAPRGCRLYNLRSMVMPSLLVKNETGKECLSYEQRANLKKEKDLDLNSDDLW